MGTIEVKNLGKAYKVYPNRWSRLLEWIIPFGRKRHSLHWVLKDLNFTVAPGEAVGIIGINGAGKSTLLKLITGTAVPTTGEVKISGRVAALLELGMGFHPDFTGRQNVLMAGQLLGYTSEELIDLMPSIEEFADIGHYIDQPVRVYSSGMQMRLAFSLATAKRPDVLIVDEALSVGDAFFQHKSFDRIREFRKRGTTLLIVSHDNAAIQSICNEAILLEKGRIAYLGEPQAAMDFYNARIAHNEKGTIEQKIDSCGRLKTESGTKEIVIQSVHLYKKGSVAGEVFETSEAVSLRINIHSNEIVEDFSVGFMIKDRLGQTIFGTNSNILKTQLRSVSANEKVECFYDFDLNLGEGTYSISIALHGGNNHISKSFHWIDRALIFEVINNTPYRFIGPAYLQTKLKINYE